MTIQYRKVEACIYEIPAGSWDREKRDPQAAALREETAIGQLELVYDLPATFLARNRLQRQLFIKCRNPVPSTDETLKPEIAWRRLPVTFSMPTPPSGLSTGNKKINRT